MKQFIELAIQTSKNPIVIITNHFDLGVVDPRMVYANDEFLKLVGLEMDQVIGESPCMLFGERTDRGLLDLIKNTVMKKINWEGVITIYDSLKNPIDIKLRVIPVVNPVDEIMYYSCFIEYAHAACDISNNECKVLNSFVDSLFEHYDYFQNLSEESPQPMMRMDERGKILYVNHEARNLFAMQAGTNIEDSLHPDDVKFIERTLATTRTENRTTKATFRLYKNGQYIWCTGSFWNINKNEKSIGIGATLKDASSEAQLLQQLQQLKKA